MGREEAGITVIVFDCWPHHPSSGLLGIMLPILQRIVVLANRVLLSYIFLSQMAVVEWVLRRSSL